MAASVTYQFYSEVYGGGLSEAAFGDSIGLAESHVRWLCSGKRVRNYCAAYKRAVCAACDAFTEFGSGETNGFKLGDFEVRRYAVDDAATGEDMATRAALRELADTGMAFCGVR
ncbi:Uncharacterised protein [Slackia heliotrinireducens]|uniref:Uncharacterized protein n=1 Tax=Slackia heliotrinireducens (strain ATCC 29202 / DSM 20476 / NCTC 11029 / RHS 1) TaxID=471855 RepID=C7N691_SLAHD|nr:hypothetical protein [Slackia heliotrinireducens]ACV22426.1 hypothetical protein Shel_14050 [Slackia heliotrinireducens DSM 20476]VEH00765.1 Uncharacterised protein [Slackia heliotrinireducens]